MYAANLEAIQKHLTTTRGLPLSQADLDGVAAVYRAFYWYGPSMNYSARLSLTSLSGGNAATYYDLMTQRSESGEPLLVPRDRARFGYIKDLEARNLIVPVVGDFAGPKHDSRDWRVPARAVARRCRPSTSRPSSRT